MNLGHHKTKPEIKKSSLVFSEEEVKEALLEYAKQKGYGFHTDATVKFHFWENKTYGGCDPYFGLRTECSGVVPGITKTKEMT